MIYFNPSLKSEISLRTRLQLSLYQQSFEINFGTQTINVNFQSTYKQFAWLEISLIYDKSNQHQIIYGSYNAELASTKIQSITLENASTTYNLTGRLIYDFGNEDDKYWLYSMFTAYSCIGCSVVPLTTYAKNKIYEELVNKEKYLTDSD